MAIKGLDAGKRGRNNEFYTPRYFIERELGNYWHKDNKFYNKSVLCPCDDPEWSLFTDYFGQHFKHLSLKRFVSSAITNNPQNPKGKALIIENKAKGVVDFCWRFLDDTGDFRTEELDEYRKSSDIIVTNPPFTLFKDFIQWVVFGNIQPSEGQKLAAYGQRNAKAMEIKADAPEKFDAKKFLIIGNLNAVTYKEIYPLMSNNVLWFGVQDNEKVDFIVPDFYEFQKTDSEGARLIKVPCITWFTNLDHEYRYVSPPMIDAIHTLRTTSIRKLLDFGYLKYDNYDAIEVPSSYCIPKNYSGVMGVPISFWGMFNRNDFEVVGLAHTWCNSGFETKEYAKNAQDFDSPKSSKEMNSGPVIKTDKLIPGKPYCKIKGEYYYVKYARLLIKLKNPIYPVLDAL